MAPAHNGRIEIAGPDRGPMNEFVERYLTIKKSTMRVVPNENGRYMFYELPQSALVPEGDFIKGLIRFDNWASA